MDCLFCKIINKEIPSKVIYEDDNYLSFLDINPNTKGHILVIPKKHVKNFTELTEEQATELIKVVKKIAPKLVSILGVEDYNLALNNGSVAGQIIDHVHWHIIPRYKDDGLKHWGSNQEEIDRLEETFNKLKDKV